LLDRLVARAQVIDCTAKRLRICRMHRWHGAESVERRALDVRIRDLEHALYSLKEDLSRPSIPTLSLRDVFDDLCELAVEFDEIRSDAEGRYLSVVTEAIALEGIEFGRFELRIDLKALLGEFPSEALLAVALDPNPCASDEAVTHPHVSGERICLGEAAASFGAALNAGRLADAFLIARSVLETYNPGSPYCQVESWYGRACSDCGQVESVDDTCWCDRCDQEYCSDCYGSCSACCDSCCLGCLDTCSSCDEGVCSGCLAPCALCDQSACTRCLDDELCPACIEAELEKENEDDEASQTQDEQLSPTQSNPFIAAQAVATPTG